MHCETSSADNSFCGGCDGDTANTHPTLQVLNSIHARRGEHLGHQRSVALAPSASAHGEQHAGDVKLMHIVWPLWESWFNTEQVDFCRQPLSHCQCFLFKFTESQKVNALKEKRERRGANQAVPHGSHAPAAAGSPQL